MLYWALPLAVIADMEGTITITLHAQSNYNMHGWFQDNYRLFYG